MMTPYKPIKAPLENEENVSIEFMLIAFVGRMGLGDAADPFQPINLDDARSLVAQVFDDAVDFTNCSLSESREGKQTARQSNSRSLKECLAEYCDAQNETDRCGPLSNALNSILMECRDKPLLTSLTSASAPPTYEMESSSFFLSGKCLAIPISSRANAYRHRRRSYDLSWIHHTQLR
ncbi:hypothetical protein AX16_010385 [Volvariella volvacea WC 439]|nr:hypothetical protein AX16_010385 [Volvariella volvacea WC 439]